MNGRSLKGLWVLVFVAFATRAFAAEGNALDRYVEAPDASYGWKLVERQAGRGTTTFVLELTSQTWLTEKEVDRPVWKHWLIVVKPEVVRHSTGMLFISGGAHTQPKPSGASARLVEMAVRTGSVVAELRGVPNQPLRFAGQTGKVEDALIAYTWDRYLRTGDERWPARLPMTKSSVRAMDAVSAFMASDDGGKEKVEKFVVSGASKRGWTAWTTAAVDQRVVGVIPIVIDTLNMKKAGPHGFAAYGFWAPAIGDYIEMRLQDWFGKREYDALLKIEDPYEYRERFTMPKLVVNATGDQYFVPDSSKFYFDDLPGEKYLRYVPNADHSLRDSDAQGTMVAFYQALLEGVKLPKVEWAFEGEGSATVRTDIEPVEVKLWQATNPKVRDFRVETLGKAWKEGAVEGTEKGVYVVKVEKPANGWTAYMVEMTYRLPGLSSPLKLTTPVRVTPDTLPYRFEPAKER